MRRWETHLEARKLGWEEGEEEEFGKVGGRHRVQRGWLTEEVSWQL